MAENSGGLFSGAGFSIPTAAPAAAPVAPAQSLFEGAGFQLPSAAAPAAGPAAPPSGSVYVPWLGTHVSQAEYDRLLEGRLNPRAMEPTSSVERVGDEARAIGGAVADDFNRSRALATTGISNIFQNQPAVGLGQAGLGALGMAFSPLAAIKHVATNLTGNPDFGDKAALMVPGRGALTVAAKAVPEVNALNTLVRDIPARELPHTIARLEGNPTLSAMDVVPNVQSKAMGISTGEPSAGSAHLFAQAERRAEEATPRLTKAFDEAMGPVPDTVKLLEKHKADVREVGRTQIEPVLQSIKSPVDITPVVAAIDEKIGARTLAALKEGKAPPQGLTPTQQHLWNLREDMTYRGPDGKPQVKDEYFLDATGKPGSTALDAGAHGIQSRLRAESEALSRSASGADRLIGGELGQIRGKLVDAIDKASPRAIDPNTGLAVGGSYRPALAKYRDEAHVQEAFDMGQTILSKATAGEGGLANRPEAWRAWMESATDKEIKAAQLGARTAVDNAMGVARNEAASGRGIPDVRFVRDKMEMIFGKKNADKIVAEAEAEQLKAHTNSLLTANSKTARSLAAQEAVRPRQVGNVLQLGQTAAPVVVAEGANALLGGGMATGLPTAMVLAAGGTRKAAQLIGRRHDIATNDAYAQWASATAPEQREILLNALRARAEQIGGGKKGVNALSTYTGLPLPR